MKTGSHEERLERAKQLAYDGLNFISDEKLDEEAVREALCASFAEYEAVCTEIGMKLGAKLALELLGESEK